MIEFRWQRNDSRNLKWERRMESEKGLLKFNSRLVSPFDFSPYVSFSSYIMLFISREITHLSLKGLFLMNLLLLTLGEVESLESPFPIPTLSCLNL